MQAQVSVLDRLKAIKAGVSTPVQPHNSLQNSPVATNDTATTAVDVKSRLKALKMGAQTPSGPPTRGMAVTSADNPLDFARDALASTAEFFGGSPNGGMENIKGLARNLLPTAHPALMGGSGELPSSPEEFDPLGDVKNLWDATGGRIIKGKQSGDPSEVAAGVGAAAPIALPIMKKLGNRAVAAESAAGRYKTPTPYKPRTEVPPHVEHLTQAVGANNKIFVEDRFHTAAADAIPAMKALETEVIGGPVRDLRDVAKLGEAASKKAWEPYNQLLDSTSRPIQRLDLLKEAVTNLPDELRNTQATAWKRIVGKFAKDLSKNSYDAHQIEEAAQTLNAKLKSYYKANNLDRASASKLPATAGDEALLKAYRTVLDSTIKADTGYDAAPLRQHYGNIKAVLNSVIETPSGDDTLFDILTHRPLDMMKSGRGGMVERVVSHMMRQTPDQLAAKAFKVFKDTSAQKEGLVHVGWETPSTPESSGPDIGYGAQTPPPPSKFLYSETADARRPFNMPAPPKPPPKQLESGNLAGGRMTLPPASGSTVIPGSGATTQMPADMDQTNAVNLEAFLEQERKAGRLSLQPTKPTKIPPKAETVDVTRTILSPSGKVYVMKGPVKGELGTGQKMLPAAGDTSVKVTPPPPESFAEALAREQTPQSARMRETLGTGPFDKQSRPATAEEYLRTRGGRNMPDSDKAKVKKPAPKPAPPPKRKP